SSAALRVREDVPRTRSIPEPFLRRRRIDLETDRLRELKRGYGAADEIRIAPEQNPVRSERPEFPVEVVRARLFEVGDVAVTWIRLRRLVWTPETFGQVLGRQTHLHAHLARRVDHSARDRPRA